MTIIQFLLLLLVAGLCGALGQAITGYSRGGCLVSVAVGLVGALLGSWIARAAHLPELLSVRIGGTVFPVVWAVIGSVLFVGVVSLLTRRRGVL